MYGKVFLQAFHAENEQEQEKETRSGLACIPKQASGISRSLDRSQPDPCVELPPIQGSSLFRSWLRVFLRRTKRMHPNLFALGLHRVKKKYPTSLFLSFVPL